MKLEDFKPLIPSVLAIGLAMLKGKSGGKNLFQGQGAIEIQWKKPDDMSFDQWIFTCSVFSHIINDVNPAFGFFDSTYEEFTNYAFLHADRDEMEMLEYMADEMGEDFDAEYLAGEDAFCILGHYASSGDFYLDDVIELRRQNMDDDQVFGAAFSTLIGDLYNTTIHSEEDRLKYIQTDPRFRLNYVQVWSNEDYGEDVFRAMVYFDKIALLHSGMDGIKDAICYTAKLATLSGESQNIAFGETEGISVEEKELSDPNNRETRIRRY